MATLRISDDSQPMPARTRVANAGPNPFADAIADSKTNGKVKKVTLNVDAVNEHVNLIRKAAADAGYGVQIAYDHTIEEYQAKGRDGKTKPATRWKATPDERGNVVVRFLAKEKRKTSEKPAETADAAAAS